MNKWQIICPLVAMLVAAVLVFAFLREPFEGPLAEVTRVSSPSGRIDAVLVERNGGATTSFGYGLYVVPQGKAVSPKDVCNASFYGAVRSASAYGVDVRWEGDQGLICQYLEAKSVDLATQVVALAGANVVITLRSNVSNGAAPAGGMLFNLRQR